jgi:PKD repeat protein
VLKADPQSGGAPLTVTFNADDSTDSDGQIMNYEWDLDGSGFGDSAAEEAAAGNATILHTFTEPGEYTVWVRVTDDESASNTDSAEVSAVLPSGWRTITIDSEHEVANDLCLKVVDGHPAISYIADGCQMYIRSATPAGWSTAEWSLPVVVDEAGDVGEFTSMAIIDGNPAISYMREDVGLRYARSLTPDGASSADWAQRVDFPQPAWDSSLAEVEGNPAIGYRSHDEGLPSSSVELYYFRSSTSSGADLSDWSEPILVDSFT